jgi:SpoVK/Ycf46/Vps4 family AAA+-type ATPase
MPRPIHHLQDFALRVEPKGTWEDLKLPEDTLFALQAIASVVKERQALFPDWDLGKNDEKGTGITVMFHGDNKPGKIQAAEVLANHLSLELYNIDLSAIVNKYIGETEKNLSRIFDAAEKGGSILIFDEADALFGKRTEVKDSHDRYANVEISYLFKRMENLPGLVILATNDRMDIKKKFRRRIRFQASFPLG